MHKQMENLTIEQMREIVDGAPDTDMPMHYNITNGVWIMTGYANRYFVDGEWKSLEETNLGQFKFKTVSINDLRTAIAKHDTTDHVTTQLCIGCGSTDLYKGGEIKEPKMCLDCFAEMVGFTRTSNGFVESDEVTDIRNHVSPSTKVIDHG